MIKKMMLGVAVLTAAAGLSWGVTISSKTNGLWMSAATWNGGVIPSATNDLAQVNHAVSLSNSVSVYQAQVGTSGTNGVLTVQSGGRLQTAYNSAIGYGLKAGRVILQAGGVWTNDGRIQLSTGANATGLLTVDGGRYESAKEVLLGGATFSNTVATLAVTNGGKVVLRSYIRFTSGTNSINRVTIATNSSLDCAYLWFDNASPGSDQSLIVNGGVLGFTGTATLTTNTTGGALLSGTVTNSLTGANTKVFFEGGQVVFREVDSLSEMESLVPVWNSWVDSGRVDSARFSKDELKQFLAWDGRTVVVNDFVTEPAAVRPANIFASGCVLQRGQTNRVWGTGTPGDVVTVSVKSQSVSAVVDPGGRWMVSLNPEPEGGPFVMTMAVPGKRSVTLTDVYYGDVWILTGQSNMYQPLGDQVAAFPDHYPAVPDAADDLDDMRFMIVATFQPATPADDMIPQQSWTRWQADRLGDMSTVGYFFARYLRQQLHASGITNLPLGFIKVCRGGSSVEEWMDATTLNAVTPVLIHPEFLGTRASLGYNGMIAPIQNYAIKGALWYQGESSGAYDARQAPDYPPLVNALLSSWRSQWRNPDLPFYFVQLEPYLRYATVPAEENWPWMREQQAACLATPGTRMASAVDIGLQWQVHPPLKDWVGERLARIALNEQYGVPTVSRGPVVEAVQVNGPEITVTFSNIGSGLETRAVDVDPDALEVVRTNSATGETGFPAVSITANQLGGFALCGTNRVFYWATEAEIISSNQVRLANRADVPAPVYVRYAWQNYPRCNLYNSEGLPAEPFRTDTLAFGAAGGSNSTPVCAGISNRTSYAALDAIQIDLTEVFNDIEDGRSNLIFSVTGNSATNIVTPVLSNQTLVLNFTGAAGTSVISVRATDSFGKSAGSSFSLTVETQTYAAWLREYFSPAQLERAADEQTVWGDLADPDADGAPNLLEYAWGLNPVLSNSALPSLEIRTDGGTIRIRYVRSKKVSQDPSVSMGLKSIPRLTGQQVWSRVEDSGAVVGEDAGTELREVILAPSEDSSGFIRLVVSKNP
jgi:sialate O-acetylesterase